MSDIAKQIVISVSDRAPQRRLDHVLGALAPYRPEVAAGWSIDPEVEETLVSLVEFETVPPPELICHLNTQPGVQLEHNMAMSAAAAPGDPLYQDQWTFYKPQ